MELTIIGSAPAEPNPGAASSCYLLDVHGRQTVLECGHGAAAKLLLYTTLDRIGAVVISHMHPDHFFDLVPLKYAVMFNGYSRIPLFVPPTGPKVLDGLREGLGEKSGFWDTSYQIETFDPDRPLELNGLTFRMTPTHHFVPAWAMRIEDGQAGDLGYTSDTSVTEEVIGLLRGVDLVLAEAAIDIHDRPEAKRGHLTPEDAGELARQAGAKRLVLTHYPAARADKMRDAACRIFGGTCDVAVEGRRYTI